MTVDFTKFPFPSLQQPQAATVTEAITAEPVASGFMIITLKATDPDGFAANAPARQGRQHRPHRHHCLSPTPARRTWRRDAVRSIHLRKPAARGRKPAEHAGGCRDGFRDRAQQCGGELGAEARIPNAGARVRGGARLRGWRCGFRHATGATTEHTIGAFRNMMRYASVSRDPNVIQFFNLFPSPGKLDVLWPSWREALPWFFEVGGILSSFPLLALDPKQPMLPGQLRALRLDQAIPRRHAVRSAVRRNLEGMLRAARRDSSNAVLLQDRAGVAFISLPDFGEGRFLQFRNALV
jgi:hypothetical protein